MNRVLIITYYWPPSGGAGVQRWLKFTKYLPESGWEPLVLTIDPAYATYPAEDESLGKEVPEGVKVFRTEARDWFRLYSKDKSKVPAAGFAVNQDNSLKGKISKFIRGNFFIPDPRRGWNRFAFKKACELISTYNIRYIITTSPPHSTQLIGLMIKKRFPSVKWLADLRDSWTDIYYYKEFYPTCLAKAIDASYEKNTLNRSDKIVTVGNNLAEIFAKKTEGGMDKISIIPNGFDEEDFDNTDYSDPSCFTLTYIGTMADSYPVDNLITAINTISTGNNCFLLRFVGSVQENLKKRISDTLGKDRVEFLPYVPHVEAIKLMAASSMLLLVIPSTVENKAITPGKVFEYIATGKPVLYIGPPDGDAAWHLRQNPNNGLFDGTSDTVIKEYIIRGINGDLKQSSEFRGNYSRRYLTSLYSEILNNL